MSWSIFHELRLPAPEPDRVARDLVAAWRERLKAASGWKVGRLLTTQAAPREHLFHCPWGAGGVGRAAAEAGWSFVLEAGPGFTPLPLGLARFPAMAKVGGRAVATGLGRGWHFHGQCDATPPAAGPLDPFVDAYAALVEGFDYWKGTAAEVEVEDDAGHWAKRSRAALLAAFAKPPSGEAMSLMDDVINSIFDAPPPRRR